MHCSPRTRKIHWQNVHLVLLTKWPIGWIACMHHDEYYSLDFCHPMSLVVHLTGHLRFVTLESIINLKDSLSLVATYKVYLIRYLQMICDSRITLSQGDTAACVLAMSSLPHVVDHLVDGLPGLRLLAALSPRCPRSPWCPWCPWSTGLGGAAAARRCARALCVPACSGNVSGVWMPWMLYTSMCVQTSW